MKGWYPQGPKNCPICEYIYICLWGNQWFGGLPFSANPNLKVEITSFGLCSLERIPSPGLRWSILLRRNTGSLQGMWVATRALDILHIRSSRWTWNAPIKQFLGVQLKLYNCWAFLAPITSNSEDPQIDCLCGLCSRAHTWKWDTRNLHGWSSRKHLLGMDVHLLSRD